MAAPKTHQDYLYKFYASLVRQRPNSKMAIAWLLKHGYDEDLLPMAYLSINPMSKKIQKPQAKLSLVKKAVLATEVTKALEAEETEKKPVKTEKKPVKTEKKPVKTEKKPVKTEKKPMTDKAIKMETD